MAAWPGNLPGPTRKISVTPGSNTTRQVWQSGRADMRRFAVGAPDKIKLQFRLHYTDIQTFEYWFDRSANLGINWFTASWLAAMGYPDHKARILGYPKLKGKSSTWADYSVTLLVQDAAYCPADTFWADGGVGPGPSPGPTPTDGLVVAWGTASNPVVTGCPEDLIAKQVAITATSVGVALKTDGTLHLWGAQSSIDWYFAGWEALGGIEQISTGKYGIVYLTTSGTVGVLGSHSNLASGVPTVSNGTSVIASNGVSDIATVFRNDGTWINWGYSRTDYNTSIITPIDTSGGDLALFAVGEDKRLRITAWSAGDVLSGYPTTADIVCAGGNRYTGYAYTDSGQILTWGQAFGASPPPGLAPVKLVGIRGNGASVMVAVHNDGTPVAWGADATAMAEFNLIPAGLKVAQMDCQGSPPTIVCVAIKQED